MAGTEKRNLPVSLRLLEIMEHMLIAVRGWGDPVNHLCRLHGDYTLYN